MKIKNICSHYTVNILNDIKFYEQSVFLNSKLKSIVGGAWCLTIYDINVGKLQNLYKNDKFYLTTHV